MEELPFADGTFDVVTGFNSFQYASSPVAAVKEAKRVARKGGYVVARS
jgi:ubiquinone/menaquinone biosynthesis C-methylase UbiE